MTAQIQFQEFPNGLVLLGERMPDVQSAAFSMLIPAGAAHEPADRPGTAAMVGEWMTRGAGQLDSRALFAALDDLGVTHSEGAQTIHVSVSAVTLGANLPAALRLFADMVRRPRLDPDEIEPIRALCLQSLASLDDDPGTKVVHELRRRHFPDPLGRSAFGQAEGLQAIQEADLRTHYERGFRPNGAILGVAGAIDWPRLLDQVAECFADWPKQPEPTLELKAAGPRQDHIDQETQQTQIAIAFPSVPASHPDYYKARAASAILGGYASARLFTEVREKRGLCYAVYANHEAFRDRAAVICYAGTARDRAQETLDVTLAELKRLRNTGIDLEELDRMRAGLKSALVMQQESSMGRASSIVGDYYHLGRAREVEEIEAALDALTVETVNAHAAELPIEDLTILTLGPRPLSLEALETIR